ncbi:DUF6483 family protein [Clostridium estertheticum]|uniref:DUF6483 family protein n=1 Tax=Clostridium estertheticum TaxID=238834 RepID=UPI001CF5D95A|nr:DUF6483 family protein [Clostridium estertheticum]MCB2357157.1 DUF6483 family protein [Clostridium estertheticum]WAG44058.1 DUF6483 family protein [Clostridium estertheticum]
MNIEKLIEDLGKAFGKIIFNKKEDVSEKINIDQMSSTDIFKIIFNKLFHMGNYNKSEDLIFDELEKNNSPEVYEVAIEFYNSLLKKSDEELNISNFPRKEIYRGLDDIQKFKVDL